MPRGPLPATPSPPLAAFTTGWACPRPGALPPAKALVLPAIDEMALRWQDEAGFCFTMPSAHGMTGTNSGDIGPQPMLLSVGGPGQALPALTPPVRAEAAGEIVTLGLSEIVVAPSTPAVPIMTAAEETRLVAWVTALLGQKPAKAVQLSCGLPAFARLHRHRGRAVGPPCLQKTNR